MNFFSDFEPIRRPEDTAREQALKLWVSFKWQCKIADHTYQTLQELALQFAERAEGTICSVEIAIASGEKFRQLAARLSEFTVANPDAEPETCPSCHLPLFICPCPTSPETSSPS